MRRQAAHFDVVVAKWVGLLPKKFYTPFLWLGRFTTPALWASYLLLVQILLLSPTVIIREGWAVIALLPLASLVKLFFRRQRPPTIFTENMRVKSYSFPSSHAYSAMLSTSYLFMLSLQHGMWWGIILLGLALVVGISRVYVGAHYPSDVIAGWSMGLSAVLLVVGLV